MGRQTVHNPCLPCSANRLSTKPAIYTLIGPSLSFYKTVILGSDIRRSCSCTTRVQDCSYFSPLSDCLGRRHQGQYDDLVLRLASWNYYPLPIDVKLLIAAAEKASWDLETPFTDAIKAASRICGPGGLLELEPALAFIELLWERPTDKVDVLFLYFLTAVAPQTNARTFVERLAYMVSIYPSLHPDAKARVIQDIETWSLIFPDRQGRKIVEEECLDDLSRIEEQN